jgi:type VI secretion system secreted protein VgrG
MAESIGPVTIKGPVEKLHFRSLVGVEQLSQPFRYDVEFLHDEPTLAAKQFLGEPLTVTLDVREKGKRHFNGVATDFSLRGSVGEKTLYAVTVRPWLWLLTQRVTSKIHSGTVPQIVKAICNEYMYSDVQESLLDDVEINREFVVQYEESDFNFVMRLLEQDGIYFYFAHAEGKHSVVLTASGAYDAEHYASIEFFPPDVNRQSALDHIDDFVRHESLAPGVFAMKDFDFTAPRAPLLVDVPMARPHVLGEFEVFHYPGGYVDPEVGRTVARRRLEALQVAGERFESRGNARGVGAGQQFTLTGHPLKELNKQYLVFSTAFQIRTHDHQSGASVAGNDVMRFSMVALDRSKPFRPASSTPKPRILGVQSAVVVGPDNHEIDTDLDGFGMVKVKFHWDRSDVTDGSNCCWIRVSQPWAGTNFGVLFTPRIGQEVLVQFLEGDPDQPIIVGRVYNNDHMPPYDLPLEKTKSGIRTRSSLDGGISNFNEIRFEDKKGAEELFVQAEKTHTVNVKGSQSISVAGKRDVTVTQQDTENYNGQREVNVKTLDKNVVTGKKEAVVSGMYAITADAEFLATSGETMLDMHDAYVKLDNLASSLVMEGGVVTLKGPDSIELKSGFNTVTIKASGEIEVKAANKVTIEAATEVILKSDVTVKISAPTVEVVGEAMIKLNS